MCEKWRRRIREWTQDFCPQFSKILSRDSIFHYIGTFYLIYMCDNKIQSFSELRENLSFFSAHNDISNMRYLKNGLYLENNIKLSCFKYLLTTEY